MQLTDTQLVVLSAALNRPDGSILPLPSTLKGGAIAKVCAALLAKGLVEETTLDAAAARAAPERVFRAGPDEAPVTLRLTDLARQALDVGADSPENPAEREPAQDDEDSQHSGDSENCAKPSAAASREQPPAGTAPEDADPEPSGKQPRSGTKLEQLIQLLRRPEGVSIKEASRALDWMEHSVRGAVAGALKKKYGLTITKAKAEERGTVYSIVG